MPVYIYEVLDEHGEVLGHFEHIQKISEPALTTHPETGHTVQRVIQAPFIGGSWSEHAMKKSVSDDRKLEQLGFTKYVKSGDGTYEKRAGKGPRVISKDQPIQPKDLK